MSQVAIALLAVITVILGAAVLKASAAVTMPLAFVFFAPVLVHPIQTRFSERCPPGCNGWGWLRPCSRLSALGPFAGAPIWISLQPVMSRAPQYLDQLQQQWHAFGDWCWPARPAAFRKGSI
jgi:hypothetical protein